VSVTLATGESKIIRIDFEKPISVRARLITKPLFRPRVEVGPCSGPVWSPWMIIPCPVCITRRLPRADPRTLVVLCVVRAPMT
jgi:hypothetical protein